MEGKEVKNARKAAHTRALARLAEEFHFTYTAYLVVVRREKPELTNNGVARVARATLRKHYKNRFAVIYEEEKRSLPKSRDFQALAVQVVSLYGNGDGPTIKAISQKLGVSYQFAKERVRDAGITPKRGVRRKSNG